MPLLLIGGEGLLLLNGTGADRDVKGGVKAFRGYDDVLSRGC